MDLSGDAAQGRMPQPKKDDTAKKVGTGCLIAALVAALAVFGAYLAGKSMLKRVVDGYTEAQPRALPESAMPADQALEVCGRVDRFREALKTGTAPEPLVLTGDDLNAVIAHHPDWKDLAGKVHVVIEGKRITGDVSIPLDPVGGLVKGRFLNGKGTISVLLADGRLMVFLDSLDIAGKTPPEWLMRDLKAKNLAEKVNSKPSDAAVIAKFESITVDDGRLRITPKR